MSETATNQEFIVYGRLSFPQLWKPKKIGNDGKPRYTANLLLDPNDAKQKASIKKIKDAIEALTKEAFKTDKKLPRERTALRKDDEPRYDGYEGMWYISAARAESQGPPLVIDRGRRKLEAGSQIPYAGCYCNLKIRLYAQDYDGVKRINASLEVVQFVQDGEPFGAGAASIEDMPEYEDTGEDADDLDADDDDLD